MRPLTIYLSGNISPNPATYQWRDNFTARMVLAGHTTPRAIEIINPCRTRFDQELRKLKASGDMAAYDEMRASTQLILPKADRQSVLRSDIMVVNLELADPVHPPIGTTHELCWAADVPGLTVIAIIGEEPNVWSLHPFNARCINYAVENVWEAVDTVVQYFFDAEV